jgi:hypothetical protein
MMIINMFKISSRRSKILRFLSSDLLIISNAVG